MPNDYATARSIFSARSLFCGPPQRAPHASREILHHRFHGNPRPVTQVAGRLPSLLGSPRMTQFHEPQRGFNSRISLTTPAVRDMLTQLLRMTPRVDSTDSSDTRIQ